MELVALAMRSPPAIKKVPTLMTARGPYLSVNAPILSEPIAYIIMCIEYPDEVSALLHPRSRLIGLRKIEKHTRAAKLRNNSKKTVKTIHHP
jgi:hypothetical protein